MLDFILLFIMWRSAFSFRQLYKKRVRERLRMNEWMNEPFDMAYGCVYVHDMCMRCVNDAWYEMETETTSETETETESWRSLTGCGMVNTKQYTVTEGIQFTMVNALTMRILFHGSRILTTIWHNTKAQHSTAHISFDTCNVRVVRALIVVRYLCCTQ